jgi:rhamnose transport system permease protein
MADVLAPLRRWEVAIWLLVVLALLLGSRLSPAFLTADNLGNLAANLSEIALMALTSTLLIVAGEIDLSVASTLGMCSCLLGLLWSLHVRIALAMLAALLAGTLAGAFNGVLVTWLGLPSLAVTIGTLALYRGLAFGLLGDRAVADFPGFFTNLGFGTLAGTAVPNPMVLFALLALLTVLVLHATPFGRALYAIGANPMAARFAGLSVARHKLILFVLSGAMSGLAGIVYTARFSSARGDNAEGFVLPVVAAVLLGGVSIFGGKGSVIGVVAAVFLIGILQNALALIDVSDDILTIVTGSLLIASVLGPNLAAAVEGSLQRRIALRDREHQPGRDEA